MQATSPIERIVSTARSWFENQIEQTERLRPMLAAAALIVFVGLLIGAISLAGSQARSLHTAQAELAKLKQQVKDGSWAERKKQVETLRFQLYERLWTAETAGLAEASLERWLRERIEGSGIKPDTIRVQRSPIGGSTEGAGKSALNGVQRMTAKVIMPFEPEALMQVLNAAASFEKILVIDRLLIRGGRNALIEMDISTFVTLPEAAR